MALLAAGQGRAISQSETITLDRLPQHQSFIHATRERPCPEAVCRETLWPRVNRYGFYPLRQHRSGSAKNPVFTI